jgi:hypothetical protein
MASTDIEICVEPAMTQNGVPLPMASKETYLKEVVILTKTPTSKEKLELALSKEIRGKKYPKDTTFYLICGFHTKQDGEVSKYDQNLTLHFGEMITNLSNSNKDMGYEFAQEIILETQETGMHILSP